MDPDPGGQKTQGSGSGSATLDYFPMLRIWDVYPGSWFLSIPDLGSQMLDVSPTFFLKPQISLNWNLFYFWTAVEKNLSQFTKNYGIELFPQKISLRSQKYVLGSWVRDPRSRIRKNPIPDPRSRGQKATGFRIRIRNTGTAFSNR
jgi:hypothetical protein